MLIIAIVVAIYQELLIDRYNVKEELLAGAPDRSLQRERGAPLSRWDKTLSAKNQRQAM